MIDDNHVTYIGTTDFRNQHVRFGIKAVDRSRHMYIIGKTGMGKSTVLENLAVQDIANGDGMVFIDPHGSAIEKLLDYIPEHRINDVIYFAPFDTNYPISFNVLEDVDPDRRHLVVNGLMASFKKIWQDAWSERMAYILTNTLLALLETPDTTLLGVNRMYGDKAYREKIIGNITDNSVKSFWLDEYNKWDQKYAREATAAIQNKIGQFTGNPLIRNIIGQTKSSFDFRSAMDDRKIVLINLSKGLIGEENMRLLGGMLITKLYLSAMSRADVGTYALDTLPPCYFYVDEFQNFANESFADILAEARKYKLNLTVANQYIAQMEESVRDAVFGNVGSMISFRVGPFDAELLERAFIPVFTQEDLVNMARFQMYLTMSIDGVGSKPFSATSLPPITKPDISYKDVVINASRGNYAKPRTEVEQAIAEWFEPITGSETGDSEKRGASAKFNPHYKPEENSAFAQFKPKKPFPSIQKKDSVQEPVMQKPKMSDKLQALVDTIAVQQAPAAQQQKQDTQPVALLVKNAKKQESYPPVKNNTAPAKKTSMKKPAPELSRAASNDQKQALRDLLKKVTPQQQTSEAAQPTGQKEEAAPTRPAEPQPQPSAPVAEPPQQPGTSSYMPSRPKEVPEDILRKVLE